MNVNRHENVNEKTIAQSHICIYAVIVMGRLFSRTFYIKWREKIMFWNINSILVQHFRWGNKHKARFLTLIDYFVRGKWIQYRKLCIKCMFLILFLFYLAIILNWANSQKRMNFNLDSWSYRGIAIRMNRSCSGTCYSLLFFCIWTCWMFTERMHRNRIMYNNFFSIIKTIGAAIRSISESICSFIFWRSWR